MDNKLSAPSRTMHWVDRNKIKPNDYNPNKVSRQNLELLTQSIFTNGWTLPIVVRPDGTIIDGFHRWTVAGPDWKYVPPSEEDDRRTLYERLEGKVLVVIVDHKDKAKNIYGTVTHNRARGTHLLEPMKKIVKELMDEGKTVEEIGKQLGMRPEEIFRLSDFSKEDFLKIQWCDGLGKKIANKDIKVKTNTNFDFLPQPKALVEYPEDIFYADFTAETYSCDPVIKYRRKESDYECCRLTDAMVVVKNCEKTKVSVEVSVGEISENLECDIKARYRSLGNRFIVCSGKEEIPMDKFLTEQPLIYKTVKDMTITGIDVIEGDFESELFDSNIIEGVDWKHYDTNLKLEFRKNDSDTRVSIQDALYKILEADEKFKYIIYDHGSGEMADYITIYETDNELVVELYHVKKMGSSSYNNSVGDVYEVSGQAIKSVTWFTTKGKLLEKFTSRHNSGHCIVKKGGNFKTMIKEIKTSGKVLRGCICIVQPGIKKSKAIPDRIQEVLAATDSYVKKAGKVNRLRIMGSI